jgi:uncharacterized protein (TIGR03382 family)
MRTPLAAFVGALVLSVAAPAFATSGFPGAIKSKTGSPKTYACTLCHTSNAGGTGTVTTLFGKFMMSRGLAANNTTSLNTALDADKAEAKDVDGDGTGDYDELVAGRDPNTPDVPGSSSGDGGTTPADTPPEVEYGCNAAGSPTDAVAVAGLVAGALVLVRRTRRGTRIVK